MTPLVLYLLCGVAIAGGIGMLLTKHPIRSAMSLLLTMTSLAGVYALLHAHLVAVLQVLIYCGAIVVLIVYILMLLDVRSDDAERFRHRDMVASLAVAAAGLLGAGFTFLGLRAEAALAIDEGFGTTNGIARLLLGQYVLAFEVAGALLLAGIVGVVYLTTREGRER